MLLIVSLLGTIEMFLFQISCELATLKAQNIVLSERLVNFLCRVRLASTLAYVLNHTFPMVLERTYILVTAVV